MRDNYTKNTAKSKTDGKTYERNTQKSKWNRNQWEDFKNRTNQKPDNNGKGGKVDGIGRGNG